jgi:hypothetical protein
VVIVIGVYSALVVGAVSLGIPVIIRADFVDLKANPGGEYRDFDFFQDQPMDF